jgi:hypothetical protein
MGAHATFSSNLKIRNIIEIVFPWLVISVLLEVCITLLTQCAFIMFDLQTLRDATERLGNICNLQRNRNPKSRAFQTLPIIWIHAEN